MDINKLAAQLEEQLDSESLPCRKCNGSKLTIMEAWTAIDGREFSRREQPCIWCDGVGHFTKPDLVELVAAVKGRKPGTLRSKRPDDTRLNSRSRPGRPAGWPGRSGSVSAYIGSRARLAQLARAPVL